jgi:hypothetical protein
MKVAINGKSTTAAVGPDDRWSLRRRFRKGDRVTIDLGLRAVVHTRDRRQIPIERLTAEPIEGALFVGPWLLGVHEADEPLFFRRPWAFRTPHNDSVVELPADLATARVPAAPISPRDAIRATPLLYRCDYSHGGWPERAAVKLRPISAQTAVDHQQTLAVWLKFRRA